MQVQPAARERNWAMAAHLSALIALAGFPLGHIIGPLVVYLVEGHESEFVGAHARASLNYQLTVSLATMVLIALAGAGFVGLVAAAALARSSSGVTIGTGIVAYWAAIGIALALILVLSFIFIIVGTVAAGEGRLYTYPFAIRFLR
jgi:uncharacterized Tic20 family protein